jgi:hypothetical protein
MMMDRQCSGIESLPFFTTEDDTPIHLHHEVVKCKGVFSVLCDIRIDKNKDLTFKEVVGEVRKVLESNIHPPRPFDLVISRAALKAKSFAPDTLEKNKNKFNTRYAELVTYKEKHGNCNVPRRTGKEDRVLGTWLSEKRRTYKMKKEGDEDAHVRILTDDQIERLEKLGVRWRLQCLEATFEERLKELREFNDKHHRCPTGNDVGYTPLYTWLNNTRAAYKKIDTDKSSNIILSEQMKQFAKIGLVSSFEEKLEELVAFKDKHNDRCPTENDKDYKKLYNWVKNTRSISKRKQDGETIDTPTDEQITQFETIGLSTSFDEKLEELVAFKDKHNDRCPTARDTDYKKLFNWVKNTRSISKRKQDGETIDTPTDEQITQFETIGLSKGRGGK